MQFRWAGWFLVFLVAGSAAASAQVSPYANPQILAEPADLAEILHNSELRILDVRPAGEYEREHISGAVNLPAPLTDDPGANRRGLPLDTQSAQALFRQAGVNGASRVVLYDDQGNRFAARVFFVLEFFGHRHVQVLNGGYRNWQRAGLETTTETASYPAGDFTPQPNLSMIATSGWVDEHRNDTSVRVVDARAPAEFSGGEVRGTRGGHIPGAVNIDWTSTLTPGEIKTFLDPAELRKIFADSSVTPNQEVVSYCQSGMRASEVYFVLRLLGYDRVRLYDGSWQEWSADSKLPVEK